MPAALLKDYYKILEVSPNATTEVIKKAYRALAFKYHPDTNPGNAYATHHFHEIQEAYSVLQHDALRRKYDEERWLNGMSNRAKDQVVITPQWILREANRLERHMATVDTYRMSHSALYDYIALLLGDSHMAILQQAGETDTNHGIVRTLLKSTATLKHPYMQALQPRLVQLAGTDSALLENIYAQVQHSGRKAMWERYKPLFIVLTALILCVLMYLWARVKYPR